MANMLSRPLLEQNVYNKWSVGCRAQGENLLQVPLEKQRFLRTHLETPYFCLYTIQQEVCNNCGGNGNWLKNIHEHVTFSWMTSFSNKTYVLWGSGPFATIGLYKKNFQGGTLQKRFLKLLSSSLKTREDDYGVSLVFGNPLTSSCTNLLLNKRSATLIWVGS